MSEDCCPHAMELHASRASQPIFLMPIVHINVYLVVVLLRCSRNQNFGLQTQRAQHLADFLGVDLIHDNDNVRRVLANRLWWQDGMTGPRYKHSTFPGIDVDDVIDVTVRLHRIEERCPFRAGPPNRNSLMSSRYFDQASPPVTNPRMVRF